MSPQNSHTHGWFQGAGTPLMHKGGLGALQEGLFRRKSYYLQSCVRPYEKHSKMGGTKMGRNFNKRTSFKFSWHHQLVEIYHESSRH